MKKVYFLVLCALSIIISVQADNLKQTVENCCAHNPELYQDVMHIIDDTTLASEEKVAQLCMLQKNARADLEGKILECVDIYTEISLQLEEITGGLMTIHQLKGEPEMTLERGSDVFKERLLNSLKKLDASAAVVLAFAVCSGSKQEDISLLDGEEKSFFNQCISVFFQKKALIGAISIGLLAIYSCFYKKMSSLKHKALNETPVLDWFYSIDGCYEGKRLCLLRKVVRDFAQKDDFSELYELIDDNVRVHTSAVEAFPVAAVCETLRKATNFAAPYPPPTPPHKVEAPIKAQYRFF